MVRPGLYSMFIKGSEFFIFIQFFLAFLFLARFNVVVSVVSSCLVCALSILATCPSTSAARFAFYLCFIRFAFVVRSCFIGKSKLNQGRGLVDRRLVQAKKF